MVPEIEQRFPNFRRRLGNFSEIVRAEELFWHEKVREMADSVLTRKKEGLRLDWEKFSRYSLPLQRRFLKQVIGQERANAALQSLSMGLIPGAAGSAFNVGGKCCLLASSPLIIARSYQDQV